MREAITSVTIQGSIVFIVRGLPIKPAIIGNGLDIPCAVQDSYNFDAVLVWQVKADIPADREAA